jgi:hypothetical protein
MGRRRGAALAVFALAVTVVVAWLGWKRLAPEKPGAPVQARPSAAAPDAPARADRNPVTIGVAYGTEKQDWLKWAADEFAKTPQGRGVRIDLKPMGSLEAAQAIVRGDKTIHVWSPASSLYKDVFVRDWTAGHPGTNPIAKESPLALTPMVFVMWDQRYGPFVKRYRELNFRTAGQALAEKGGWGAIAGQPDWMFFKFSHTNPNSSNSGLVALALMGYEFAGRPSGLAGRDITDPRFQSWIRELERSLTGAASGLNSSTGYLMTAMVQRGWSTYDAVYVYESVAIDRLKQADGRWGPLRVVYPKYNMWNENPYYLLDVPWSDEEHRRSAGALLEFLLSEPVQREAMAHGFRPANVNVPTRDADSPFVRLEPAGVRGDVPGVFCEPPSAEVLENLLLAWQRGQAETR